jgi:glycosyltransferase involved in cell wall biosynthesis
MHVTYLLGAKGNLLYDGKHEMAGRFQTYGQHSFILDLVGAMTDAGHDVCLVTDDLDGFPLTRVMSRTANVTVAEEPPPVTDLILVDEASDRMLERFSRHIPAVKFVHHAGRRSSDHMVERCRWLVCMTENALARQARMVPADKLALIRQGVDLARFSPPRGRTAGRGSRPRVLVHCRMDSGRERVLSSVMEHLDREELLVYAVGDGPGFWDLSDRFGDELILINHVPCLSVPNLLAEMDVVISLGRGAMEAMAAGIPTICAGYGYAGVVSRENIGPLLTYNLTGAYCERDPKRVMEDVRSALAADRREVRRLAEEHLSIGTFADRMFDLVAPETAR